MNTVERSPARDLVTIPHTVESGWWSGEAGVRTFVPEELVATKIRALYQRKKGRDLFDLWLALTEMKLDPGVIVDAFAPYRPEGMTARRAELNLREKVEDVEFSTDLEPLVGQWPTGYDVADAAELVIAELHGRL